MTLRIPSALLVFILSSGGPAVAAQRELGAHVHGQAAVELAVDGNDMDVTMRLPGHDAVGFEHPPASDVEKASFAHARNILQQGRWFEPAAKADCALSSATVEAKGLEAAAAPGAHAEFTIHYRYRCAHPDRLDAVDLRLVEAFPSVQRIVVDVVTPRGSDQQVLERGVVRVDLAR